MPSFVLTRIAEAARTAARLFRPHLLCTALMSVPEKVLPFVGVSHGYPQPLKLGGNVPMRLSVCESNVHCPMRKHFHGLFMKLQLQHRDVRRLYENKPRFDLLAAALSFSEPHGV
ncbi:MAG: hypothetical protein LUG84_01735 [Akkermansiaceae bacterium]|nr:hypothetical protein [Akkermansiaceae bacterium]